MKTLCVLFLISVVNSETLHSSLKSDEDSGVQIQQLHNLLIRECPQYSYNYIPAGAVGKREVLADVDAAVILEADKVVFARMFEELEQCRRNSSSNPSTEYSTTAPTTRPTTRPTTAPITRSTAAPTTAPITTTERSFHKPPPQACWTAVNYSEPWRMDHNGSHIKPGGDHSYKGYKCDLHNGTSWFRLTGDAGNRILDTCPVEKSCGCRHPMWTPSRMPEAIGVKAMIVAYSATTENCKYGRMGVEVYRCSYNTDHDFIYRVANPRGNPNYRCMDAFCGME